MGNTRETKIHFEIRALRFGTYNSKHVAFVRGFVEIFKTKKNFELTIEPITDGQWRSIEYKYLATSRPIDIFYNNELIKELVNRSARMLDTVNMWPSEQSEMGARVSLNQRVIPADVAHKVLVSFRSGLLNLEGLDWKYPWDHIERRITSDPYFEVLGFEKAEIKRITPLLKSLFTADWIKAKYKLAGLTRMGEPLEPDNQGWFPAYHLARTANGSLCRDPGWNYLVEIGLSLESLSGFEGIERLRNQLIRSPGTQHHLCMAAELLERGYLIGLEPTTGLGSASNDLLVKIGERVFQVELKEFASKNPGNRLQKEIADKSKNVPKSPQHPVVFHAVLLETGMFNKELEDAFFTSVCDMKDTLPENISAVVAGKRFVDSLGGRIKRDIECVVVNDSAINPIAEEELLTIFAPNYSDVQYPVYGIGSFFVFGNCQGADTPESSTANT